MSYFIYLEFVNLISSLLDPGSALIYVGANDPYSIKQCLNNCTKSNKLHVFFYKHNVYKHTEHDFW